MKANLTRRFLTSLTTLSCLALLAAPAMADDEDYEPGDLKGPKGPISAVGLEYGLELYDTDKADNCVPGALQIRATVTNVTKVGMVKVELFGENDFMKKSGKLRRIRVPAEDGSVKICINLPAPGEYALVGYHDENGDRRLKKAWNFKPKEPYGVSNNPKIDSIRLPKWSEAGFQVPMSGADITLELMD
ncbi:DUF2141 domain-containing protein [Hellea sp.]|nr:DUF2141 domain-containing protein [Hellea sp.]